MSVITPAEPSNVAEIAALLEEMDRFYGANHIGSLDIRLRQINEALFAHPPLAYAILARDQAQLVGIATYSFLWPAVGLTRSLYLKELYVAQAYRRQRIGTLLMEGIFEIARKQECSRVEWTTDTDNSEAQRFYEHLNVSASSAKLLYRVEGKGVFQLKY